MMILKIMLAIGIAVSLLRTWIMRVKRVEYAKAKAAKILVFLGIIVLVSLSASANYKSNRTVAGLKEQIIAGIEKLRYESNQNETEKLVLYAEKAGRFYLRGEVYNSFEDGKWQNTSDKSDDQYAGMLQYLAERKFYPQIQITMCMDTNRDLTNTVTIQNTGASRKYVYVPLTSSFDGITRGNQTNCDRILPEHFWGDQEYTVEVLMTECQQEYEITPIDDLSGDMQECEMIYRAYVYDHYLAIPKAEREKLERENLESVGGTTQYEVLESVHSYLEQMKQQSAEEYATKAALLLRYCGIPTRYVNGFYADYDQPNSRKILSRSDQHQWIEVYIDGVGFATFETDPKKFRDAELAADTDSSKVIQNDAGREPQKQEAQQSEQISPGVPVLIGLALVLTVLVFWRKMKKKRRQNSKNIIEFASFLCIRLEKVLKYDNVILDITRPYQYQEMILEQYGSDLYSSYMRFIRYTDEIQFNDGELSKNDRMEMRKIVRDFEMYISEKVHPIRRIWMGR
ncbi:MAG: transglutaminase-like domain-containing protein [Hespellia sp.]|nr:transglutaminase-like domain-containing protein [Hespellia sp.]